MAVFKRKGSQVYRTRFTINGIRIDQSTKECNKHDAERFEHKLRAEVKEELVYGVKLKHSWAECESRWFNEMKHKRTLNADKSHFKYIEQTKFFNLKIEDITKQDIENLASTRESTSVSPATINRMLALVKAVLNRANKHWGWIDKVPYISMRKESKGRIRWETRDNINRILFKLDEYGAHHTKRLVELATLTGLRKSNLVKMEKSWVNIERRTVTIPAKAFKTDIDFTIPLNNRAMEIILSAWDNTTKFVFTKNGKPISGYGRKAFEHALTELDIKDFRFHDLRHTWATWYMMAGGDEYRLQKLGGWSNSEMPRRYAHLAVEHLRKESDRVMEVAQNIKEKAI